MKEQASMGGGKEKDSEDKSPQAPGGGKMVPNPAKPPVGSLIRVEQKSLWEVFQNWRGATKGWVNFMLNNFGVIPDEIVVSRATYHLIFTYLCARGAFASGNWLDLDFVVSYNSRFGAENVMFYDWWTGAEIIYGGGSDVIQFFEKDIIKKTKSA